MVDAFDVFALFDYYYIAAVVLAIEFLKIYIPKTGTMQKAILTLLVAIFMAGLFIGIKAIFKQPGVPINMEAYIKQLMVSFFGVTALYSIIVKPILDKLKK